MIAFFIKFGFFAFGVASFIFTAFIVWCLFIRIVSGMIDSGRREREMLDKKMMRSEYK